MSSYVRPTTAPPFFSHVAHVHLVDDDSMFIWLMTTCPSFLTIGCFLPETKFVVPDWGDIVDSGIGLSYRSKASTQADGPVGQPYAGVNYMPQSGTKNLVSRYLPTETDMQEKRKSSLFPHSPLACPSSSSSSLIWDSYEMQKFRYTLGYPLLFSRVLRCVSQQKKINSWSKNCSLSERHGQVSCKKASWTKP